jgi:hypothetical protein
MGDTIVIEVREVAVLTEHEKEDLISFAEKAGSVQKSYLKERFLFYPHVIILRRNDKVGCFQFIEYLDERDETFIYLGPLFSKMSRFLPMFLDFFQNSVREIKAKTLHLLAEIQNPEVFLLFKVLFGNYSYPHIHQTHIPSEVKRIAAFFSSQVSHMSTVNLENLSTKSKESLYHTKSQLHEVNHWLLKRGIDLMQGDNVLLIATVPLNQTERDKVVAQVNNGITITKNWREGKQLMLQQFKEGI